LQDTVTNTVPAESVTAHNASATITEDGIATLHPIALDVGGEALTGRAAAARREHGLPRAGAA
jgi:hypothetical protein